MYSIRKLANLGLRRASVLGCRQTKSFCTEDEAIRWPKKIFSGIQPTGSMHIGNYLGAVRKWVDLQEAGEDVTYCIVDMHSITLPQDPRILRLNILKMTATLLACGIDPVKSTLYVQSSVKQHTELGWILSCLTTMPRLSHLPQYKEKTKKLKDIPLGLFVYPVLQAADIMVHKATHVPVGEDQIQHIQLAQHLAKIFNYKFGTTFPQCHGMISDSCDARIKSLRNPSKKMSKSDEDQKSAIYLTDEPDQILEKIKKAVTDFTSAVTFEPETRQGVSNLIMIDSLMSGDTIEEICEDAALIDTGKYKLRVAETVIDHLNPIRSKIEEYMNNPEYLVHVLEEGRDKAAEVAERTMLEVKERVGLGAMLKVRQSDVLVDEL